MWPGSLVANNFGYPTKNWEELGFIVISVETKVNFEAGVFSDPNIFSD